MGLVGASSVVLSNLSKVLVNFLEVSRERRRQQQSGKGRGEKGMGGEWTGGPWEKWEEREGREKENE